MGRLLKERWGRLAGLSNADQGSRILVEKPISKNQQGTNYDPNNLDAIPATAGWDSQMKKLSGSVSATSGALAQVVIKELVAMAGSSISNTATAATSSHGADVSFDWQASAQGSPIGVSVEVKKTSAAGTNSGDVDLGGQTAAQKVAAEDDAYWAITNNSNTRAYVIRRQSTSYLTQQQLDTLDQVLFGQVLPSQADAAFCTSITASSGGRARGGGTWPIKGYDVLVNSNLGIDVDLTNIDPDVLMQADVDNQVAAVDKHGQPGYFKKTIQGLVPLINNKYPAGQIHTNPITPEHKGDFGDCTEDKIIQLMKCTSGGNSAWWSYKVKGGKGRPILMSMDKLNNKYTWYRDLLIDFWPQIILNAYELGCITGESAGFEGCFEELPENIQVVTPDEDLDSSQLEDIENQEQIADSYLRDPSLAPILEGISRWERSRRRNRRRR